MDLNLYQPEDPILDRLEQRLKGPLSLREVYAHNDLQGLVADATHAPALAVMSVAFRIADTTHDSVVIDTRWQVVAIAPNLNDRRGAQGRDQAGQMAAHVIANLIGWQPAANFGPLRLEALLERRPTQTRVFAPLVFAASTTIDAIE